MGKQNQLFSDAERSKIQNKRTERDTASHQEEGKAAKQGRRMPSNLLNAFDPGWKPPAPWFIPLGDPIRQGAKAGK